MCCCVLPIKNAVFEGRISGWLNCYSLAAPITEWFFSFFACPALHKYDESISNSLKGGFMLHDFLTKGVNTLFMRQTLPPS